MPVPHNFSRKLHEVMGSEAADSMADWMNRSDENTSELRREVAEFRQTVRADFAELRQEMSSRFADLRQEMNTKFAGLREEMNTKFAGLREEMNTKFAGLREEMNTKLADLQKEMRVGFASMDAASARRHADFMKWTLGFWTASLVTLVAAVAGLAITLR